MCQMLYLLMLARLAFGPFKANADDVVISERLCLLFIARLTWS